MNRQSEEKRSGIPHLAKNERDMGHPSLVRERETILSCAASVLRCRQLSHQGDVT